VSTEYTLRITDTLRGTTKEYTHARRAVPGLSPRRDARRVYRAAMTTFPEPDCPWAVCQKT